MAFRLRRGMRALGRHPWWTAAGVLIAACVAVRLALPFAIAMAVERFAPDYLVGTVEVGDVDLSLVRAAMTLDDVTAYGPGRAGTDGRGRRWFHAERARIDIAWRPLFDHVIRVQQLLLERPFLAAARSADGVLDLPGRVRPQPASQPTQSPWTFMVDDAAIRGGRVRFRDLAVSGEERLRLDLRRIETKRLALDPAAFERAGRVEAAGTIAGAPFDLTVSLAPTRAGALAIGGTMHAHALPLQRVQAYVPALGGVTRLAGGMDLDVGFVRQPGRREAAFGRVAMNDVAVRVRRLDQPALAWRSLVAVADSVDLTARRAAIRTVHLESPSLVVQTESTITVPAVTATSSNGADAAGAAPGGGSGATAPFAWTVGDAAVEDGRVLLVDGDETRTLGLAMHAHDVAPDADFPLTLSLELAPGTAAFDGEAAIEPARLSGHLTASGLPMPVIADATGDAIAGLQAGTLDASLDIRTIQDQSGSGGASSLDLSGSVTLAGLRIAADDPDAFSLAWDRVEADATAVRVPLGGGPTDIRLARLAIDSPSVSLRRTETGFVLPGRAGEQAPSGAVTQASGASTAADAATASPGDRRVAGDQPADDEPAAPSAASAGSPDAASPGDQETAAPARIAIDEILVSDGVLAIEDRAVEPFYRKTLRDVDGVVRDVRWPDLRFDRLELTLLGLGSKPARITGRADEKGLVIDAKGTQIALAQLNPYITRYSDYTIEGGQLTFGADLELELRRASYDAQLSLRLHDLGIGQSSDAFRRDFGVTLALAMALLRDVRGNIVLSVPISGGEEGTHVGVLTVVRRALHRAVLNALASPLKLIGAVVRRGGEVVAFEPEPIPFHTGSSQLASRARDSLSDLAEALAQRPNLGIELHAVLLQSERIALSARAEHDTGNERYPATPEALAAARIDAVRTALIEQFGIPAARIETQTAPTWKAVGPPRVEIALQPSSGGG